MSFEIKFINEKMDGDEVGEITIGDFKETFLIPIDYWSKKEYEAQWKEAVENVVNARGDASSMLITTMCPPEYGNHIVCWPVYKVSEDIFIHNSLIFINESNSSIDKQNLYDFVSEREKISEDTGEPISEWQVSLEDLRHWLLLQGE